MRKLMIMAAMAASLMMAPAAMADDTATTAAAAAGGAAVGTVVQQLVKVGNNSVDCNAIPVKDLSQTDFSNIQQACAALNKQPEGKSFEMTPDDVKEWGSLAKEFGSAIGSTAKELGVAVNDFLRTPAGVLITVYLFWSKLGGIIIGIPFVIAIWFAFFKVWNTFRRTPKTFEHRPVLFGLYNKKYITEYTYREPEEIWWSGALGALVTAGISAIIICTIIL